MKSTDDLELEIAVEISRLMENESPVDRAALLRKYPDHPEIVEKLCQGVDGCRRIEKVLADRNGQALLSRGQKVGEFRVRRRIGRGGMGEVYLADHLTMDRPVALKVFPPSEGDRRARNRFLEEARRAGKLHDSHLAEIYGLWETDGVLYYAMEYLRGPSLADLLFRLRFRGGELDARNTKKIVQRIAGVAAALGKIHADGLVHRDVKPGNILLREDDGAAVPESPAVLIDFGLARSVGMNDTGHVGSSAFTKEYAAPEQITHGIASFRSDVYSLGVTLAELLTGKRPRPSGFSGLLGPNGQGAGMDRNLAAVLDRATAPDPKERYEDASEFNRDLQAWLNDQPVLARPLGLVETMTYRLVRYRWLVLKRAFQSLAGLMAAAFLLVLLGWFRSAREAAELLESGDFQGGRARLESIPALASAILPLTLEHLAERLEEQATDEPVAHVLTVLERMGLPDAVLTAAAYLERDGLDRHPWLAQFLLRQLETKDVGGRSNATLLTARLFLDLPDRDAETMQASAPFRARLMQMLREDVPENDKLYALTALAGCGTPDQLYPLFEWLSVQELNGEAFRMGIVCAERIVRRCRPCGTSDYLNDRDWSAVTARSAELAQESLEAMAAGARPPSHVFGPWSAYMLALTFLQRSRGVETQIDVDLDLFPDEVAFRLRCALRGAGNPDVARTLEAGHGLMELTGYPELWGFCCAYYGDNELTRSVVTRLPVIFLDDESASEVFLIELEKGRQEVVNGRLKDFETDDRSHLAELLKQAKQPWKPKTEGRASADSGVLATWDFLLPTIKLGAEAGEVRVSGDVRHVLDEGPGRSTHHWRMSAFGSSWMELDFELPEAAREKPLVLRIRHLAATRRYVPYQGLAYIDVSIGGHSLVSRFLVSDHGFQTCEISISPGILEPGPDTLTIRLPASTTTYWLREIELSLANG